MAKVMIVHASTMSGHKSGVQARLSEEESKALYTHCLFT